MKVKKLFGLVYLVIIIAAVLAFLFGCNPVKQVLKDESKKRQVWEQGVLAGWCANDTVIQNQSDTTVLFDTLFEINTDTIWTNSVQNITVEKVRVVTKTVTIRDTVTNVVTDNSRIGVLQGEVSRLLSRQAVLNESLAVKEKEVKDARRNRNKWRIYFFVSVTAFAAWIFRKPILKLIKHI